MTGVPSWLQMIDVPMTATLGSVNVYLIRGPEGIGLVDTGLNDATSEQALTAALKQAGIRMEDVESVVCTHHHVDHSGLGKRFQEAGATVWMSPVEAACLAEFYDHPERDHDRAALFGRHGLPEALVNHVKMVFGFFRNLGARFQPTLLPEDGRPLMLGGIDFEVIPLPGHTAGHIGLFQPDAKVVMAGDVIIANKATQIDQMSPIAASRDLFGDYLSTLDRLTGLGTVSVYPGHGSTKSDIKTAALKVKSHLYQRMERVREELGHRPQSVYELAEQLMTQGTSRSERTLPRWMQVSQTLAYLNYLTNRGAAERMETETGIRFVSGDSQPRTV